MIVNLDEIGLIILITLSVTITIIHTLEETLGPGGPIWEYLGETIGVGDSPLLYYAFQAFVCGLAVTYAYPEWLWLLASIRFVDALFTHVTLTFFNSPNPGVYSGVTLLVLDGALAVSAMQG